MDEDGLCSRYNTLCVREGRRRISEGLSEGFWAGYGVIHQILLHAGNEILCQSLGRHGDLLWSRISVTEFRSRKAVLPLQTWTLMNSSLFRIVTRP